MVDHELHNAPPHTHTHTRFEDTSRVPACFCMRVNNMANEVLYLPKYLHVYCIHITCSSIRYFGVLFGADACGLSSQRRSVWRQQQKDAFLLTEEADKTRRPVCNCRFWRSYAGSPHELHHSGCPQRRMSVCYSVRLSRWC